MSHDESKSAGAPQEATADFYFGRTGATRSGRAGLRV